MADLEAIVEGRREGSGEDSGNDSERGSTRRKGTKRRGSRKRQNSAGSEGDARSSSLGWDPEERRKEDGTERRNGGKQTNAQTQDLPSTLEDPRSRFFENYRKEAEEYDKEFMKKHDEDLNTTLIFAGLFSAVTSAFIIEVNSQLRPDPNDETAALLRVLIHKIDNTTFGDHPPTLPQWTGPPSTIVHAQAILFASLATSLISAFLAMLGKQWLNRYASTDKRGTTIERSQNRQRKLDGIVTWYFDYVLDSLPLMLQIALLLLGGALSRYLWEVNITVASVVLGISSLALIFYIFVVIAGAASESCPYQTPGARVFRLIILPALRSTPSVISEFKFFVYSLIRNSRSHRTTIEWLSLLKRLRYSRNNITSYFLLILSVLIAPIMGAYLLGRALLRSPVALGRTVYRWFVDTPSAQTYDLDGLDRRTITLDLRCISWMLQTSLDRTVHLSALKHLVAMTTLTDFDPALVAGCFNAFVSCVDITNSFYVVVDYTAVSHSMVVITQGMEQFATVSALCLLRTISHLSATDPKSNVLKDLRQRYAKIFPETTDFYGHPFHHIMGAVHSLFARSKYFKWDDYKPSTYEHRTVARALVQLALFKYRGARPGEVSDWILRFALHSLSLDPPPPAPVIADCLSIIAIDLDCGDIPNTETMAGYESVLVEHVSSLIVLRVEAMIKAGDTRGLRSKWYAFATLLPYAIWQERDGRSEMLNTFTRAARAARVCGFRWDRAGLFNIELLSGASPRAIALASPHVFLHLWDLVPQWAEKISTAPRTEEVAQGVIDMLFQIASEEELISQLPADIWSWLTSRPSLPPFCRARSYGTRPIAVKTIRALNDIEILKSYFFVAWSEWDFLDFYGVIEMCTAIREDFGGIGMQHHRADLIQQLVYIHRQLDRGLEYLTQHNPELKGKHLEIMKEQYGTLEKVLLEVESRSHAMFMCALPLPCP